MAITEYSGRRRRISPAGGGPAPRGPWRVAARRKAHVSALLLVSEPFMRALVGRHLPEEFVRQHMTTLEREADERLAALTAIADAKGVRARGTARDRRQWSNMPAISGPAGPARGPGVVVGPGTDTDEIGVYSRRRSWTPGRPALVVPAAWSGALPPKRALVAWDGLREAARAAGDAVPLLQAAEDSNRAYGRRTSRRRPVQRSARLRPHHLPDPSRGQGAGQAGRGLGRHCRHHPRPGGRGEGGSPGDGRLQPLAGARDDVRWRDPLDHGKHDLPDPGLALTPTCGQSCASVRARCA